MLAVGVYSCLVRRLTLYANANQNSENIAFGGTAKSNSQRQTDNSIEKTFIFGHSTFTFGLHLDTFWLWRCSGISLGEQ
jgi:hypothetical protein